MAVMFLLSYLPSQAQRQLWTVGTANTMSKGDIRLGIAQPSAYGLSNSLELAAGGFYFPLAPNLALKKQWLKTKNISLASRHAATYPGPLLRSISGMSYFNYFPDKNIIPDALGVKSEIILSLGFGYTTCPAFTSETFNRNNTFKGHTGILSFKLGAQTGFPLGDIPFPLIEEAVIHPQTAFFNEQISAYAGIDWDGRLLKYSDIKVDLDYTYLNADSWALEHKTQVNWYHGWRYFHFLFGYYASYVQGPTRSFFFIGPVIDFMWTLRKDKIQKGLFKEKMF